MTRQVARPPHSAAPSNSPVQIELKEKNIVWVLPVGGECRGAAVQLPGGALILGHFSGTLICNSGAIILAPGSTFSGYAEADEIFVTGNVKKTPEDKNSVLLARRNISVSSDAVVEADLTSRTLHLSNNKNFSGQVSTLV